MPVILTTPSSVERRLGFTVRDVLAMSEAGIFEMNEKVELIEGELVPMQAHNPPHMRLQRWLMKKLEREIGATHWVVTDSSFYLAGFPRSRSFTLPDVLVYPLGLDPEKVQGRDCALLIEVADSTLRFDLGRKARLYAEHGVGEYWVCDVAGRVTHVHRDPADGVYPPPHVVGYDAPVTPRAFPGLALTMAEGERA